MHLALGENTNPYYAGDVVLHRGLWAYGIKVSLVQSVSLRRDPTIVVFDASTWEKSVVGLTGIQGVHNLRGFVVDLTDRFVNDYLAANPAGR